VGGIALGSVALALTGLAAYVAGTHLLRLSRPATGTLMVTVLIGNTGNLGLPLSLALLGPDTLGEAVAYHELVQSPWFYLGSFAVGAAFGTAAGEGTRERVLAFVRNPPLIGALLGLAAPAALAPDLAVDITRIVAFSLLPIGFFVVAVTLAAEGGGFSMPRLTRPLLAVCGLRLVVAPLLLLALAAPLVALPTTYVVQSAMPVGITGLVVAHRYGLEVPTIAAAVAWSTLVVIVVALAASLAGV
jgi:hypothetical protein